MQVEAATAAHGSRVRGGELLGLTGREDSSTVGVSGRSLRMDGAGALVGGAGLGLGLELGGGTGSERATRRLD